MDNTCQHVDGFGRCHQHALMVVIPGSFRIERKVKDNGNIEHTEHCDYEPGPYCYYHQKIEDGLISRW